MAYAERSDVEMVFGADNIAVWADLNNNEAAGEITARIVWAAALADAEIDDTLRNGPYTIPFASPYPVVITDIAARLAGMFLYDARRLHDETSQEGGNYKYNYHRKYCHDLLYQILNGYRKLAVERTPDTPIVPKL